MTFSKKSLGQNFLIDKNIIKKITNLTNISNQNIFEIGPGKGSLTSEILKHNPKSLTLVEKDKNLYSTLIKKYKQIKKINLINEDILKTNLDEILLKDTIVFGNLPYNISSQILVKFIRLNKWPPKYSKLIFMFQKEVAEKVIGTFGTTKYGRLSILTDYRLQIGKKFDVSPNSFSPKPKVISSVLLLEPKQKLFYKIKKIENLEKITAIFFSNKRKMINKNIIKIFNNTDYLNYFKDLNLNLRPSDLRSEKYFEITKLYEKLKLSSLVK